jgi:hypothetical protein
MAANTIEATQKISAPSERGRGLFKIVINASATSSASPASKYHRGTRGEVAAGPCF